MSSRLHWYAYCFAQGNIQVSTYIGYRSKKITIPRIMAAKKAAKVGDGSVMLSATYMGKMTIKTMRGDT